MLYEVKVKMYSKKFDIYLQTSTNCLDTVMLLKMLEYSKVEGSDIVTAVSRANVGEVGVFEATERGEKFQIEIQKFKE